MVSPTNIRRHPRSRLRDSRAFTIIEVAVATGVLTLAIGTALITLGRGFNSIDTARCLSYSSQILQSELEKMRLTQWGDGTTAGTGTKGVTKYLTTPEEIPIDDIFHTEGDVGSRMKLVRKAEDIHDGMIQVTYIVSWNTREGRPMSRTYTTYYGKNGLYDFFSM